MQLLRRLLSINSPSGNELPMRDFLINYFQTNKNNFATKPVLYYGDDYQDCLAVRFGMPRIAVFAHLDTVAYMSRYGNQLIEIGSPAAEEGSALVTNTDPPQQVTLKINAAETDEPYFYFAEDIELERGTELVYSPYFFDDEEKIISPYLDNRIGIYNALQLAEELENALLVFTCWEEHQGGSAAHMARFAHYAFGVRKALISDVTWTSTGIQHKNGAVISLRDAAIPRRAYVNQIISVAKQAGIPYQVEVEDAGGSDGNEIQKMPYSIDWCFVGVPCSNMHSPRETVYKKDLHALLQLYRQLLLKL